MMIDLGLRRQFLAEEVAAVANLKTPQLVEALAPLPREKFLRPGPWLVRGEADFGGARTTADPEAQHVYHNYSIAIDAARQLFNGAPGIVAASIDALTLARGDRVLHVGAGLGYYSGLMAHVVGEPGRVVAVEVDAALASEARANLAAVPWVEVRLGDATGLAGDESFDAILVSAGVTHPQRTWLDALALGGRMILSLTATMPATGPLGKGFSALFTKTGNDTFSARVLAMTAIYSGVGLRDEGLNRQLGQAMMRTPFPRFSNLRTDAHLPSASCWLHSEEFCLGLN
jgi:protein-L-isoaspartate(D-aspartate) O-methyltransferase